MPTRSKPSAGFVLDLSRELIPIIFGERGHKEPSLPVGSHLNGDSLALLKLREVILKRLLCFAGDGGHVDFVLGFLLVL